ncbi:MAG: hypothetical protein II007_01625 [Gammaproteobacteria bacterium]|nr:hypothetical protein [Gammaproteobacteria bacterium]
MLFGDASSVALEISLSATYRGWGRVFIWIDGIRFGQDDFDEELDHFFHRALKDVERNTAHFYVSKHVSGSDYKRLVDLAYDDEFDGAMLGIPEIGGGDFVESTIIRWPYAFDRILLGCVPAESADHIVAFDDERKVSGSKMVDKGTLWSVLKMAGDWCLEHVPPSERL